MAKPGWMAHALRSGVLGGMLLVSGCGGYAPNLELLSRGPSPEFSATALKAAADNQQVVMVQISRMAGIADPLKGPQSAEEWSQFGIVALGRARIECNAYITELMKIEEHRRTVNQALTLGGAFTSGVLALSGAAGSAIAITAMAFGLAQDTVDNVTTGLLYSLGAEPVQALVANMRAAYVQKLTPASWKDRATAFGLIYGYLELCTPVVLREKIKSAVTTAQPVASTPDSLGGPPRVLLSTQAQVIATPDEKLPPPPPKPVATDKGRLTEDERADRVSDKYVRQVQQALCVAADGDLGGPPGAASATRTAMRQYISGSSGGTLDPARLPPSNADELTRNTSRTTFDQARDDALGPDGVVLTCAQRSAFLGNAYEVGRWGHALRSGSKDNARSDFQLYLGKMQRALGLPPVAPTDDASLVDETRKAIGLYRQSKGLLPDMPTSAQGFDYTLAKTLAALPD